MSTTEPTSRRDYFAANAPADPPEWFQPVIDEPPLPEMPPLPPALGNADHAQKVAAHGFFARQYAGSQSYELAKEYEQAFNAWKEQCNQVQFARDERRYFAWRWYYAEKVIEANPKKPQAGIY